MSKLAAKEPTTVAGVLAQGRVRIVATPEQLTARRGWWKGWNSYSRADGSSFCSGGYGRDERAEMKRAMSSALPFWLRDVSPETRSRKIAAEFAAKDRANAEADRCYLGDNPYTAPHQMTAAQKLAELGKQHRRLAGYTAYGADESMQYEETAA